MVKTNKYLKISSLLLFLFCMVSASNALAQTDEKADEEQITVDIHRVVKAKHVCMLANEFFDKEQISVKIKGKTYYGFCPMCVMELKQNPQNRFAIDPLSGERVNKAKAVLGATPRGIIYYFESVENMKKFEPTLSQIIKRY